MRVPPWARFLFDALLMVVAIVGVIVTVGSRLLVMEVGRGLRLCGSRCATHHGRHRHRRHRRGSHRHAPSTTIGTITPDDVLHQPATRLAERLRAGELTSQSLLTAFIQQAEAANSCMNVIVDRRYAAAMVEARAADAVLEAARSAGTVASLPPFLGVPCSIKEVFACAGMRQTSGLVARRDFVPKEDAPTVARLKRAGFIPFASTNVSELCMWYESSNYVHGRSNNAYDHGHIVGGSSGGEAALISAAGAPAGIGSDIGGSIRMPAAFNGIFGHKPTGGLIPNSGQYPTTFFPFMCTGPLCRFADDLWPMVQALAGPDGVDTCCTPIPVVRTMLPLPPPRWPATKGASTTSSASLSMVLSPSSIPAASPCDSDGCGGAVAGGGVVGKGGVIASGMGDGDEETKTAEGKVGHDSPGKAGSVDSFGSGGTDAAWAGARMPPPPTSTPSLRPPSMLADTVHPAITDWSQVTVWMVQDLPSCSPLVSSAVQPSIIAAMHTAAATLQTRYGCQGIQYMPLPELRIGFDIWAAVLGESGQQTFHSLLDGAYGNQLHLGAELLRWCFGLSPSTLPALVLALIEDIPGRFLPNRQRRLVQLCHDLQRRFCTALSRTNGVLLFPVHPTTAPPHDTPLIRPFNVAYTQLFNVLEVPCTVVPMGLDDQGLPVAIQVIGARGFDHLTVAVAQALERAGVAGWIPPSTVAPCVRCGDAASVSDAESHACHGSRHTGGGATVVGS